MPCVKNLLTRLASNKGVHCTYKLHFYHFGQTIVTLIWQRSAIDRLLQRNTVCAIETVTLSFDSVQFERRPLLHIRRSVSVLLARASAIILVGHVLLTCQKLKANSFASFG